MNKFATIAILVCAYLAVGSCSGYGGGYGGRSSHGSIIYGNGKNSQAASAASSAASNGNQHQRPVEILAGPRAGYGQGHGSNYGGGYTGELLRPINLGGGYGSSHGGNRGYGGPQIAVGPIPVIAGSRGGYGVSHGGYGRPQIAHGGHKGGYGGARAGYGPRWSVQPAGATLLNPGQNNYKAYVSPPEYSKVVLPVVPAAPVAKIWLPENNYGSNYGSSKY
ncbi:chorion protein S19 [Scaptodrosophila lebanonensis]|uniref:Chorion protein S19 n=1 Tax=Drosophila lebanonensis TaxID=7225 RepID=A0A6J2T7B1_DROLE|nr:chorion protein S19 [Scaptodrosophila lebanonensis]